MGAFAWDCAGYVAAGSDFRRFRGTVVHASGQMADNSKVGISASLIVGGLISLALCFNYVPQQREFGGMLILPLIALGLILGFAIIYGCWSRTRVELKAMLTEGIVPYVLVTVGLFAVIGLAGSPIIEEPNNIIGSIWQVNLLKDGTKVVPVQLEPAPLDVEADAVPFRKCRWTM